MKQDPKQNAAKPLGKRKQIAEILRQHYGSELETPNPKQLKNFANHMQCENFEYETFSALLGMYAGYYVISTTDQETPLAATRLHFRIFSHKNWVAIPDPSEIYGMRYEEDGTMVSKGSHTRIVYGKSVEHIQQRILDQIAYNAKGRSQGKGLWQRRLPLHLQNFPDPDRGRWDHLNVSEIMYTEE